MLDIAALLRTGGYRTVVADPFEGYNPTHDLCRVLIDAALLAIGSSDAHLTTHYDYSLTAVAPIVDDATVVRLELDNDANDVLESKLRAARAYRELSGEVDRALASEGVESQAQERLRELAAPDARRTEGRPLPLQIPPAYEVYGEARRRAGHYRSVLRYREHFVPIADALHRWALHQRALLRRARV